MWLDWDTYLGRPLVEGIRSWLPDGRETREFMVNGRLNANVTDDRVTLQRRFGSTMPGRAPLKLSFDELETLIALIEHWHARRDRWPTWFINRQPSHQIGHNIGWYQAPGAEEKPRQIGKALYGPDQASETLKLLPGRERVVRVWAPTLIVAGFTRTARIRRVGVPGDPRGVLVGAVYRHADGTRVRMKRDELRISRKRALLWIERHDMHGLKILSRVLRGETSAPAAP